MVELAVSYLFIAIVWANHHHLLLYATETTPRLIWFNFAHLFSVSLLPLSTAWMAISELAPQPVAFYAAVFFLVNATYIFLIWELIDRSPVDDVARRMSRIMRLRSGVTLCVFGSAAVVALKYSSGCTRNVLLLPDRLSEAGSARSGETTIASGSEVEECKAKVGGAVDGSAMLGRRPCEAYHKC